MKNVFSKESKALRQVGFPTNFIGPAIIDVEGVKRKACSSSVTSRICYFLFTCAAA
jgi:hypothetical protein